MGADITICEVCGGLDQEDSFGNELSSVDAAVFGKKLCIC